MLISKPTKHIKELCKELGDEYKVTVIDFANVINRDLSNYIDVEIYGIDFNSDKKKATICVWYMKSVIVEAISNINQNEIGKVVDKLYDKYEDLTLDELKVIVNELFTSKYESC